MSGYLNVAIGSLRPMRWTSVVASSREPGRNRTWFGIVPWNLFSEPEYPDRLQRAAGLFCILSCPSRHHHVTKEFELCTSATGTSSTKKSTCYITIVYDKPRMKLDRSLTRISQLPHDHRVTSMKVQRAPLLSARRLKSSHVSVASLTRT